MVGLTADDLERAFELYFNEIDRCVSQGCYFALLHVIFALPDVCASMESPNAAPGERYKAWCQRYHNHPLLLPEEFYKLRCALLHQGQALGAGRYRTYSFAVQAGISAHRTVVSSEHNITLDPRQMGVDMKRSVQAWFTDLRDPVNAARLTTVRNSLPSLMREQQKQLPGIGGVPFIALSST
jgi:hypothetical protein